MGSTIPIIPNLMLLKTIFVAVCMFLVWLFLQLSLTIRDLFTIRDRKESLNFLRKHGEHVKGRVLNVGCGRDVCQLWRCFPNAKSVTTLDLVDGLRFSWHPWRLYRYLFHNWHPDVVGDIQHMPHVKSNHYDCVVVYYTFNQIPHLHEALKEIKKVLKKDGVLLATFNLKAKRETWHNIPKEDAEDLVAAYLKIERVNCNPPNYITLIKARK